MKLLASLALVGAVSAATIEQHNSVLAARRPLTNQEKLYMAIKDDCPEILEKTEDELHYQLGQFSRTFDKKNWDNAMTIYEELKKHDKQPKIAVTTKELYDHSFSFPKVRNYDYAVENMTDLEAAEDNLNKNIFNAFALSNFIEVAKRVRANLNKKYDIGFMDPADENDWQ